ncbi:MAG: SpoIIE family protein phosphatase [Clostridia bacterium]|nr:SpoIIE family protein phosphatase [Clostridia bacterium]
MKTDIIKYILYAIIFAFLGFIEWKVGIAFLTIPFFYSLVLNKQNVLIIAPLYFGAGLIFDFSLLGLAYLASPIVVTLIAMLIHYKIGVKLNVLYVTIYCLLSYAPRVVTRSILIGALVHEVAGVSLGVVALFAFISVGYAVLKKKLNYPLSGYEKLSFMAVLAVVGLGFGYFNVYFFSFYDLISLTLILCVPFIGWLSPLAVAVGLSVGIAFHGLESVVFTLVYATLCSLFPKEHSYFGGVIGLILKVAAMLLGIINGEYLSLVAPCVATLLVIVLPAKIKRKAYARFNVEKGEITRALINQNRLELKEKLMHLAGALSDIGLGLGGEYHRHELNAMELSREVVDKVCKKCSHYPTCKKCLGGNGTEIVIQELMGSAIEMGKASILDASPFLSSRCVRLNGLIIKANEILFEKQEESKKTSAIAESKRLLKEQVDGLSEILECVATDAGTPLRYAPVVESKLRDAFNEQGVGVSEIIVYDGDKICLNIREQDARKSKVREIVSRIMGHPMWIVDSKDTVDGNVSTFWEREPKYRVAYGERVSPASDYGSGDKEVVVRLNSHKVMLCLSDGMGHGEEADENSRSAVSLISSLYRAGFDHLTVLRSVESLLKVRNKEEFNAVDIAVIDTDTGEVDTIKQGAREGYIITPDGLTELSCGSLPLGIVEGISPIAETHVMSPRDFIVLCSDGVIDGLGKENLEAILSKVDTRNPDEICSVVMENIERLSPEHRDDCSMICARLF